MRQDLTGITASDPMVTEARFLSILDTAVDGICVIDETGRILTLNRACERLFGYTVAEAVGENVRLIMPTALAARHDDFINQYLEGGDPKVIGYGREVVARHKNGREFPMELSVGEVKTEEGRQFVGIMRDLRPRKIQEERLNRMQSQLVHFARVNAMDEMGAAIAHELNQPLTAVMLYLQAISRKARTQEGVLDEKLVEILGKAVREAQRAGQIIQRMRQFVENREAERRSASVGELIDEALELVLLGQYTLSVSVVRDDEDGIPPVDVDPVQIQQILVNLIRNALEVVKNADERWIRISSRQDGDDVVVEVADSGPGIPPANLRNLFRAFSSTKKKGLGLGLAISKSIAQSHGGDLSVDAGGDGRGAIFTLKLPLDRGAPLPAEI
ncbi:two-component system sensor kinase FixL [Breoghania corrubedonensis]|uniref:Sensor protein FixL n=1 Tax=Breoghania corrubedonensis TaxID=665038 RepID=A0A2T5VEE9_9HYPH|nr:PAS domain S-box protein [Breoghania corrubedonensis]PTW62096.1 two-component system sensor kinase FixL [Breoghania corrubedonensis]